MKKSDWNDSLTRYEAALDPYTQETASGDLYISPDAPAHLVKMYDHLVCTGLEYGYLELTTEGAIA